MIIAEKGREWDRQWKRDRERGRENKWIDREAFERQQNSIS